MAGLAGELVPGVLPGVLRTIYVERRTGLLHVTRAAERASVCFVHGNIVYGSTNIAECQLGETLVRHGMLRQHDRERARGMVTATGQRLGQILLDLGLLDADGLEDGLALQVREVLLTIFTWPDGRYVFEEQDPAHFRGYDKALPLSTGEVILDAVWSIADPAAIRLALGDLERVLTPASDPLLRFQRIALSATDGFILSRIDGVASAREILAIAPVEGAEAERSLCGLLYTGMVEFLKPAQNEASKSAAILRQTVIDAYAALPGQNYFEVLGVKNRATSSELLAAYFRLCRMYHPDQHHRAELRDQKVALEALFARVGEAHRVLSDGRARALYEFNMTHAPTPQLVPPAPPRAAPAPPPEPEASPIGDPQKVEEALSAAEGLLEADRAWDAILAVDAVLPLAKGRARRRGRLLKAQAHLRFADGSRAAEEELKAALAEDAAHPEAHYLLGTIYKSGGALALAASEFRKALGLKPRYPEAQAALLELGPPPEPGSEAGRLFRRLTGR